MNDTNTTAGHASAGTGAPTTAPGGPPQRRLVRLEEGALFAGVATGLGAYFGIDPVLVRLAFVVLAFAGGAGLVLYLACWIAMPKGSAASLAGAPPADPEQTSRWVGIGLVTLAVVLVAIGLPFGTPVVWAVALILLGVLLFRWDADRRAVAAPGAGSPAAAPAGAGQPAGEQVGSAQPAAPAPASATPGASLSPRAVAPAPEGPAAPPPGSRSASAPGPPAAPPPPPSAPATQPRPSAPPPPPTPPSILGRLAVGVALVLLGVLALLDARVLHLAPHHYVAIALTVTGLALVVGAWWGRARGLIAVGLLLIPVLVVTSLFGPVWGRGAAVGEQFHAPVNAAAVEDEYRLLAGELTIDLTALEAGETVALDTSVAMGDLFIRVPADADVTVRARVVAGEADLLGRPVAGFGLRPTVRAEGDGPVLDIDASVGFGRIRVLPAETDDEAAAFERSWEDRR